ncbi:hypothetical protein [Psychrobacter immobilis]|uniref:hypothetical protein n=1 Tax=Psychrobacter immobilis TaxID=498 RepID=UPI00191A9395|nr:hypothetical protein [Psychrobacter immobilis]
MKKIVLKCLVILVVMVSAGWIFLDIVSVKETKSFSSSDGDIFNSSAADKISSFLTIFSNQGNEKQIFYEKLDKLENVNHELDESVEAVEAVEDKTSEDK